MENKKGSLSTVFLVIAIILIVVMGTLLYMQKTEADRQIAELKNNASELQGENDGISNAVNNQEKTIKEILTPSGFSDDSLYRVVLYSDNTVYVINYDGAGFDESNIKGKTLIAKKAEAIEYNVKESYLKTIIVKGKELEIIETFYDWIEFYKKTQFDTEFYELEEIAKEYRNYKNITNFKDFEYDLDGDGIKDKITLSCDTTSSEGYSVKLNGEKFSEGSELDEIYIVDLNENDSNIEVVIFDDGPSADPNYTIYSKNGNKMVNLKNISGEPLKTDKKGTILVKSSYNIGINGVTTPEIYFEYYIMKDGKIQEKNVELEDIKGIELRTSHLYFSENYKNNDEITTERGKNNGDIEETLKKLNIEKLNENTTFEIISVTNDGEYKIYVELLDGRKGYIFYIQWAA